MHSSGVRDWIGWINARKPLLVELRFGIGHKSEETSSGTLRSFGRLEEKNHISIEIKPLCVNRLGVPEVNCKYIYYYCHIPNFVFFKYLSNFLFSQRTAFSCPCQWTHSFDNFIFTTNFPGYAVSMELHVINLKWHEPRQREGALPWPPKGKTAAVRFSDGCQSAP